jgi:hypothetical protein
MPRVGSVAHLTFHNGANGAAEQRRGNQARGDLDTVEDIQILFQATYLGNQAQVHSATASEEATLLAASCARTRLYLVPQARRPPACRVHSVVRIIGACFNVVCNFVRVSSSPSASCISALRASQAALPSPSSSSSSSTSSSLWLALLATTAGPPRPDSSAYLTILHLPHCPRILFHPQLHHLAFPLPSLPLACLSLTLPAPPLLTLAFGYSQ